jgi:hypothetical protein
VHINTTMDVAVLFPFAASMADASSIRFSARLKGPDEARANTTAGKK